MDEERNFEKEEKKKYKSLRNAAIVFGIILPTIGLLIAAIFVLWDQALTILSGVLSLISLFIGIVLAFRYYKKAYEDLKKKNRPLFVATIIVGILLPIYFIFQWFAFHGGELSISLGCVMVGILMFIIYQYRTNEQYYKKLQGWGLPLFAIIIETLGIAWWLLELNGVSVPGGIVIAVFAIIAPIMGVILGLQGLFVRRGEERKLGKILSFIAAILPFACVATIIIFASQGVWLIRFM